MREALKNASFLFFIRKINKPNDNPTKKKTIMKTPRYTRGPNKHRINQTLCQVDYIPTFGETHPLYPELRYQQTNKSNQKQQWVTVVAFDETVKRNRANAIAYYHNRAMKGNKSGK